MNNKGRGSGLLLLSLLLAAVLVAWLAVQNMSSLGSGKTEESQQEQYVDQAQDAVDALNQRMGQSVEESPDQDPDENQ